MPKTWQGHYRKAEKLLKLAEKAQGSEQYIAVKRADVHAYLASIGLEAEQAGAKIKKKKSKPKPAYVPSKGQGYASGGYITLGSTGGSGNSAFDSWVKKSLGKH